MHELTQDRTCRVRAEDLVAYADGTLRGGWLEYVEAHVQVCPACRAWLADFEDLGRLLRESTPVVDDPAHRLAIVARLEREAGRRPRPELPRWAVIVVPLVVLLVALVAWTGSSQADFPLARWIHFGSFDWSPFEDSNDHEPLKGVAPSQPGLSEPAFHAVEPERLPFDLVRIDRSTPNEARLELLYENQGDVTILLTQMPAREGVVAIESSEPEAVIEIGGTHALMIPDPRPDAVAGLLWERHGVFFELLVIRSPRGDDGGFKLPDARLVVATFMAEQDLATDR